MFRIILYGFLALVVFFVINRIIKRKRPEQLPEDKNMRDVTHSSK